VKSPSVLNYCVITTSVEKNIQKFAVCSRLSHSQFKSTQKLLLFPLMSSPLLVLLYIALWKLTTALTATSRLDSEKKIPKELRQPVDYESLSLSSHLNHSSSSSSLSSPLSLCITPSLFHSWLKTYLFHKSFPP